MSVNIERRGEVAYVTLSRPQKRNALDWDVIHGLVKAARTLRRDRHIRAVILQGEGPSFCSGLDFPQVMKRPGRVAWFFLWTGLRGTHLFQEMCWAWRRIPVPVIAVLRGHCYGGGMQLALAADYRMSTPDCEIGLLEAKWGLIPDMTATVTLRELMPIDQAKRLAMTGKILSGTEAKELNLVTEVVDAPLAAAQSLAEELCTRSPDAVAASKSLLQRTWTAGPRRAFRIERWLQGVLLVGRNQRRALRASLKKETPTFRPRSRWWG